MDICLRKAEPRDFDAINALFVEMLRTIYKKDDVEGYQPNALDYYFAGGEDWICLAEIDGKVEGFLAIEVHREENTYLYYDDFSISEDCRGKGVGSVLMNKAEEYAKSIGVPAAVLHVEETNTAARRFYEKRGFQLLRVDGSRLCLLKQLG